MAVTVFTIGYEEHPTPGSLIQVLRKARVRRLVDVRELPHSRRRGFSKTQLSAALVKAGIEYEHVRELGNPSSFRQLYRTGRISEGAKRYRAHLHNGSYGALIELSKSLYTTSTCLLCFEAAPGECHRTVIVEALSDRLSGIRIVHL
jgi:uncharacterized protein (DUF488 family)